MLRSVACLLVMIAALLNSRYAKILCEDEFCICLTSIHPESLKINCTINEDLHPLTIDEHDLPINTDTLIITGATALYIAPNAFSHLIDVRYVHFSRNRITKLHTSSAVNLTTVNLFLEIDGCQALQIESNAFTNNQGPLSVYIHDCNTVDLGSEAFSWLLDIEIENVGNLSMKNSAFQLDYAAPNIDDHGPGMTIHMKNINETNFPSRTFGSSAALISLERVAVGTVEAGAFTANTYNIVMAINSTFRQLEAESFAGHSIIENLLLYNSEVEYMETKAIQSGIVQMKWEQTRFNYIQTNAMNASVSIIVIIDCIFHTFEERGLEMYSWNKLQMERNSFDELAPNAIVAPSELMYEFIFVDNEIEMINTGSIGFIGQAYYRKKDIIVYKNNYYGQPCHCNIASWLAKGLATKSGEPFENESYCTVDEFLARCFNVPEQNMLFKKFHKSVCNDNLTIQCETFGSKGLGSKIEIRNPRFPHKKGNDEGITERNKKVIGIVIVTAVTCVLIVMIISLIRWMRRRGYCANMKNFIISSNASCGVLCDRLCACRAANILDNAVSVSQLSVIELSERHLLNEPRAQDTLQETAIQDTYAGALVSTENKITQTLPEKLTKELLDNLKEKLDDPDSYIATREMIEHLYELIKVEENCKSITPILYNIEENIYELPFQNTTPRIGKNKKQMISIGTHAPSLDKLAPYNEETALAYEYFEPKDLAIHLYAEIVNYEKDRKPFLGAIPDVVAEQAVPRGPYLRAVCKKMDSSASTSTKSPISSIASPTLTSDKSTASNNSGKMVNRPLPEKPAIDLGEGTSFKHG